MSKLLTEGIVLTVIGMSVVYAFLVVLLWMIQILTRVFEWKEKEAPVPSEPAEPAAPEDDLELVLAAAAGYFLETESPEVYIPDVRRNAESNWGRHARTAALLSRRTR